MKEVNLQTLELFIAQIQ